MTEGGALPLYWVWWHSTLVFSPLRLPLYSFDYGAALPPSFSLGLPPFNNPFAIRNRTPQRSPTGYGPWVGLAPSWLASRKAPSPSPASNKMLEVHRCRQIEWSPSPVVALATSVNGVAVAAARENGVIEIWSVAAGSVGWHCQLVPCTFSIASVTVVLCGLVVWEGLAGFGSGCLFLERN